MKTKMILRALILLFGLSLLSSINYAYSQEGYTQDQSLVYLDFNSNLTRLVEDHLYDLFVFTQCEGNLDKGGSPNTPIGSSVKVGTAFVIGEYLVTLNHIITEDDGIYIKEDYGVGRQNFYILRCEKIMSRDFYIMDRSENAGMGQVFYKVKLEWNSREKDLAIFSFPRGTFLKPIPLKIGSPDELKTGDLLMVIGKPEGFPRAVMREGRVANAPVPIFSGTFDQYGNDFMYLIVNIPLATGDSGSPIIAFRKDGTPELIGIAAAKWGERSTLGFVLRIDAVKWYLDYISRK